MSERPTFSTPVVIVLAAGVTAIFALSMVLLSFGGDSRKEWRSSVESRSAIGHKAFYETLSQLGYPVERSIVGAQRLAGSDGVLIMAEPGSEVFAGENVQTLQRATNVLYVLPKRIAWEDRDRRGYVEAVEAMPVGGVERFLSLVDSTGRISRAERFAMPADLGWTQAKPEFASTVQLIRSTQLKPVIGTPEAMLLGLYESGDRRVLVLSEPDLIENHGLRRGGNAELVRDIIALLYTEDMAGAVVFDDAIHGIAAPPANPFRMLFEFPFVVVTLLGVLALGLLLWATMARFGPPLRREAGRDYGKGRLIANTAALLEYAGHFRPVMQRYIDLVIRDAGKTLHAPAHLRGEELAAWLDKIGQSRNIGLSATEIRARGTALAARDNSRLPALFEATRDIHLWKHRITHGSSARSPDR